MPTIPTPIATLRQRSAAELDARLPAHLARLGWNADQLATHQRDQLRRLLDRALRTSPFHRRRLDGVDPSRFELDDLAGLPTMTKAAMMDHFDDVVTDRRLDLALVEQHLLASHEHPSLLLDEFVCLASGGSSGRRGVFVQTIGEYNEFVASIVRPSIARMNALGGAPPDGLSLALVGAASPIHSTGFGGATASGPVRATSIPVTLPLFEIVQRLQALQPLLIIGYPTKLAQLADEQRAGRLSIAPLAVTATSELLTAEDNARITAAFGVATVDQFASTEGLVGHSLPGERELTFALDNCLVELVDERNQPVPPGVPSAKVLVTNLHNLTQPIIRYELSDRFVATGHDDAGRLRARVDGRADETFRFGDVVVHPSHIRTVLVATASVVEYRVTQTSNGIVVAVVTDGPLDAHILELALAAALHEAGLADADVIVDVVDHLARDPQTGKLPRFVPV